MAKPTIQDILRDSLMESSVKDFGHWKCVTPGCGAEWSAAMGDNEIPELCPHCTHDVEIFEVSSLDEQYQSNFKKPWLIQFANGCTVEFDTEDEACEYQMGFREIAGLDPDTGENI